MSMLKPNTVNILGINYRVEYVDKWDDMPVKAEGAIESHKRLITLYDNDQPFEDNEHTFLVLLHEALHAIDDSLNLKCFMPTKCGCGKYHGEDGHKELGLVALALSDFLFRNGFIKGHK